MNGNKKHIELKDNNEINGKISELYNKLPMFSEEFVALESLLINILNYKREGKLGDEIICDKISGEDITNARFLDDLRNIIEEYPEVEIDLRVLKCFAEYIDFKKTNINVSIPVDIDTNEQEFLKNLDKCNKRIYVDERTLLKTQDISWLKEEKKYKLWAGEMMIL